MSDAQKHRRRDLARDVREGWTQGKGRLPTMAVRVGSNRKAYEANKRALAERRAS